MTDALLLGMDFGTSTTLVAIRSGAGEPRVLRLEGSSAAMPSYIARVDGKLVFGQAAVNAGVNAHSIKLLLRKNEPIAALDGMLPTDAAFELIAEALRRALEGLKRERRLPQDVERLEVASNVGCTPAFDLADRTVLRDICNAAGLQVKLVDLVEEPIAAAFEVSRTGAVPDGTTMVIDIGGGTLDVAILDVAGDGTRFVTYATAGAPLAGDRFTQVIMDRLLSEISQRRGIERTMLGLSRQSETALWTRAEEAKLALSDRVSHRVALPDGDGELGLERDWFEVATHRLGLEIVQFVTGVYRQARLTLGRGGEGDRAPGTSVLRYGDNGEVLSKLSTLQLESDGIEHLDLVYLIGGGSRIPALRLAFTRIFGDRLFDLEVVGLDTVESVVLGLARHQSLGRIELRYPNWGVRAHLRCADGRAVMAYMYEPWAPVYKLDPWDPRARTGTPCLCRRRLKGARSRCRSCLSLNRGGSGGHPSQSRPGRQT